ncbi:tyrosine-type recombinase/integrase [Bdellovibrio sp.]|uniref:tyrosine-type recombinase/integrase n=1 Tax=Bdellovibrio sp. TaxID=28201 RepID=UPI003221A811
MDSKGIVSMKTLSTEQKVQRLIEVFLSGRKGTTIKAYQADLECFRRFVGAGSIQDAIALLIQHGHGEANYLALAYKNSLVGQKLSPATVNRRLAALRSVVKLGATIGVIGWKLEVQGQKSEAYRDTRGPDEVGIRKIIAHLRKRTDRKGIRDLAIFTLFFGNALRASELLNLELNDLDLVQNRIQILSKGKNNKQWVSISLLTREALTQWLNVRGSDPGYVFVNFDRAKKNQGRISLDGICEIIKKIGSDCGIALVPHKIRHSSISSALNMATANGWTLDQVRSFSRHSSLSVMARYWDQHKNVQGEIADLVTKLLD